MRILARRYDTAQPTAFEIEAGRIVSAQPIVDPPRNELPNESGGDSAFADQLPWIAPGLVDLQVNGYGGREFCSPDITVDDIAKIVAVQRSGGVARFLPTVTTSPFEVLRRAMATLAMACDGDRELARRIPGIHLEGPYISPEDGPRVRIRSRNAGGPIGTNSSGCKKRPAAGFAWSRWPLNCPALAISLPGSLRPPASRPSAIPPPTATRFAPPPTPARLSTHLGNGSHRMLRRHPNYLWDQIAEDRLVATVIADGHHLPPEVLKTIVRAKSPERVILISDLSGMAGLAPGRYTTQLCDLEILADGRLVLAGQDQLLAGARRPLWTGITEHDPPRRSRPAHRHRHGLPTPGGIARPARFESVAGDAADFMFFHFAKSDGKNAVQLVADSWRFRRRRDSCPSRFTG